MRGRGDAQVPSRHVVELDFQLNTSEPATLSSSSSAKVVPGTPPSSPIRTVCLVELDAIAVVPA